jgi:hypothetical protein
VQPTSHAISRDEPQSRSSLRPSLSLPNEIRRGAGVQGSTVRTLISDPRRGSAQPGRLWLFRQPVVRSGGAVHRPAVAPRPIPFPAAESLVARVSPSPTKDVFSIGDSNRNRNGGFVVKSFHGRRSHETLATNGSNHSLDIGSLPCRARCRQDFANAHVSHLFSEVIAKDRIAVPQQITRELVKGECLPQLLSRPLRGWVGGHIECRMRRRSWANTRNT